MYLPFPTPCQQLYPLHNSITSLMASRIAANSLRAAGQYTNMSIKFYLLKLLYPNHSTTASGRFPTAPNRPCVRWKLRTRNPSDPLHSSRSMASGSNPPPEQKAAEIIQSVPSNNLVTKTGTVVLGTGLLATAISQELYVMNEETVVMVGTFILFGVIAKVRAIAISVWGCYWCKRYSAPQRALQGLGWIKH